jgi:hypothetical protein
MALPLVGYQTRSAASFAAPPLPVTTPKKNDETPNWNGHLVALQQSSEDMGIQSIVSMVLGLSVTLTFNALAVAEVLYVLPYALLGWGFYTGYQYCSLLAQESELLIEQTEKRQCQWSELSQVAERANQTIAVTNAIVDQESQKYLERERAYTCLDKKIAAMKRRVKSYKKTPPSWAVLKAEEQRLNRYEARFAELNRAGDESFAITDHLLEQNKQLIEKNEQLLKELRRLLP